MGRTVTRKQSPWSQIGSRGLVFGQVLRNAFRPSDRPTVALQNCTFGASCAPVWASKYSRGLPMPNTLAVML